MLLTIQLIVIPTKVNSGYQR